jgi:Rrf2 family protein
VIHISEASSLALHSLAFLAGKKGKRVSAQEVAASLHCSAAHLAKVLQRLARLGMVRSSRGPQGGFVLAARRDLTLLDIVEAIDRPPAHCDCLYEKRMCNNRRHCIFGGALKRLRRQAQQELRRIRLQDVAQVVQPRRSA